MQSTYNQKPKINPIFKSLLPPLTEDEKVGLEAKLRAEGCIYPLDVWRQTDELVEGHHRFEICERLNIKYSLRFHDFADTDAVLEWIVGNQAGRRNWTAQQRAYYILSLIHI